MQALVAAGIGCVGLAFAAYAWYRYVDANTISIAAVVLALLLVVLSPVYFVVQAFPKGCKACKRAFASKSVAFPAGWRDVIQRYLAASDPATWQQLCHAPMHALNERALLTIQHCAVCGRIGQAHLALEEEESGGWKTSELCEERVVESPVLTSLIQLADVRNGALPPGQSSA
jgi:hypothetical protein